MCFKRGRLDKERHPTIPMNNDGRVGWRYAYPTNGNIIPHRSLSTKHQKEGGIFFI